jgi:hypothetical protein
MKRIDSFQMTDSYSWTTSQVLREALVAAKNQSQYNLTRVKCVAVESRETWTSDKGRTENRWQIGVYGNEVDVCEFEQYHGLAAGKWRGPSGPDIALCEKCLKKLESIELILERVV